MGDHHIIDAPFAQIAAGSLTAKVKGFQYPGDKGSDFATLTLRASGSSGLEISLFLTPSECGALAERLLAVQKGIEDATGEAG